MSRNGEQWRKRTLSAIIGLSDSREAPIVLIFALGSKAESFRIKGIFLYCTSGRSISRYLFEGLIVVSIGIVIEGGYFPVIIGDNKGEREEVAVFSLQRS